MSAFVAMIPEATHTQMLALAAGVNAALRGDCSNTGSVAVGSGASGVTIRDRRCRVGRYAVLVPLNAAAAESRWYLSAMALNEMTFTFTTPPSAAASFGWVLMGSGTE